MKDILLYQVAEMIENFIEAEHSGAIQITDVEMEDSGYHNEDEERSLNITIDYVPLENEKEKDEPTFTIEVDGEALMDSVRQHIKENIKDFMKVTY